MPFITNLTSLLSKSKRKGKCGLKCLPLWIQPNADYSCLEMLPRGSCSLGVVVFLYPANIYTCVATALTLCYHLVSVDGNINVKWLRFFWECAPAGTYKTRHQEDNATKLLLWPSATNPECFCFASREQISHFFMPHGFLSWGTRAYLTATSSSH